MTILTLVCHFYMLGDDTFALSMVDFFLSLAVIRNHFGVG